MPIIRSSSVLYKWLLPVVFGVWFSSYRYGVELRVVCPVCGLLLLTNTPVSVLLKFFFVKCITSVKVKSYRPTCDLNQ